MFQKTTTTSTTQELHLQIRELREENSALERSLREALELAAAERRRAAHAEDSAKRAWKVATWTGGRRREVASAEL